MSHIRITSEKTFTIEDGTEKRIIRGFCDKDDKTDLPTKDIINGSYFTYVDEAGVTFFDEATGAWG